MRHSKPLVSFSQCFLYLTLLLVAAAAVSAQTGTALYSFTGGADGSWPKAGVVVGPDGALYGATQYGGANQFGTVYRVAQNPDGTWSETVIYSFTDVNDGAGPIGPITFDAAGNVYGTTAFGAPGVGTVFKLSPNGNGTWSGTMLYSFSGGADGKQPMSGVTIDKGGNLYGTTLYGGLGSGVLYKLSPNANGTWTETVVHAFGASGDGYYPSTEILVDAAGNLYGATSGGGGSTDAGVVYEFSPNANGSWTENILYTFTGKKDGAVPTSLIFDKVGHLFGTAGSGGITGGTCGNGCGTVFRLAQLAGVWVFNPVYTFNGTTGAQPNDLAFDSKGNLFGTTLDGGVNYGVVFELKHNPTGHAWTYTQLYNFGPNGGVDPVSLVVKKGILYGTTYTGPCYLCGTVWEVTP